MSLERLKSLELDYEETVRRIKFPLSLQDRQQLKDRRKTILAEARTLAGSLGVVGDQWFTNAM
jgi:hypothetical protein